MFGSFRTMVSIRNHGHRPTRVKTRNQQVHVELHSIHSPETRSRVYRAEQKHLPDCSHPSSAPPRRCPTNKFGVQTACSFHLFAWTNDVLEPASIITIEFDIKPDWPLAVRTR